MSNNIFSGIYATDVYPALKQEHFGGEEAGKYLQSVLSRYGISEGRILDICCGEFTDGKYLVERGYKVDGLEASEEFIESAREKSPFSAFIHAKVEDNWVRETNFYNLAYCMASFYLVDDPYKLISSLSRSLMDDGWFVFDFYNKDAFKEGEFEKEETFENFDRTAWFKIEGNRRRAKYLYKFHDGKEFEIEHISNLYSIWDISSFLQTYFSIQETFSNLSFEKVAWNEDRVVTVIARK